MRIIRSRVNETTEIILSFFYFRRETKKDKNILIYYLVPYKKYSFLNNYDVRKIFCFIYIENSFLNILWWMSLIKKGLGMEKWYKFQYTERTKIVAVY